MSMPYLNINPEDLTKTGPEMAIRQALCDGLSQIVHLPGPRAGHANPAGPPIHANQTLSPGSGTEHRSIHDVRPLPVVHRAAGIQ